MKRTLMLTGLALFGCGGSLSGNHGPANGGGNGQASSDLGPGVGGNGSGDGGSIGGSSDGGSSNGNGGGGSGGSNGGGSGGTGGGGSGGTGGGGSGGTGGGGTPGSGLFPSTAIWYQDVSQATVASDSQQIISGLNHAWGTSKFQIDFSINVLHANASTSLQSFAPPSDDPNNSLPDCDTGVTVPVPVPGALESETTYGTSATCDQDNSDCHLIVIDDATHKLYEIWEAQVTSNMLQSTGCLATWDLTKDYGLDGRGAQCTSADAAGYPMAALLLTADEVASGSVNHALRFILPNAKIRKDVFLKPATHAAGSGPTTVVPYGAHLRLKASFDMTRLTNPNAKIIAKALQTYGMFLADGGNVPLTFAGDEFTTHKWSDLGFDSAGDSSALGVITPDDFEVVQHGAYIKKNDDCTACKSTSDCSTLTSELGTATTCDTTLGKCVVTAN